MNDAEHNHARNPSPNLLLSHNIAGATSKSHSRPCNFIMVSVYTTLNKSFHYTLHVLTFCFTLYCIFFLFHFAPSLFYLLFYFALHLFIFLFHFASREHLVSEKKIWKTHVAYWHRDTASEERERTVLPSLPLLCPLPAILQLFLSVFIHFLAIRTSLSLSYMYILSLSRIYSVS